MPSKEKLIHVHPSAVAIFVPGFGNDYAKEEVTVVENIEGDEKDISSINWSLTVKNTPGTFSMVLQDDQNKFIVPDVPEIEVEKLYGTSQRKRDLLSYTPDNQKTIVREEYAELVEGPTFTAQGGRTQLNKYIVEIRQIIDANYLPQPTGYMDDGSPIYDADESLVHRKLRSRADGMNELIGVRGVREELSTSTDPTYDPGDPIVKSIVEKMDLYDELEPRVKIEEQELRDKKGLSPDEPLRTWDSKEPTLYPFNPKFIDPNYGNYYEHNTYSSWQNASTYILIDIDSNSGKFKNYPTQYVRRNGGDIEERWALLDDSSIVFLSRSADDEVALAALFEDTSEIEKTFTVSPYEGPEEVRSFKIKKIKNLDLTETYRDESEQGTTGFKKGRCKIKPMDRVVIFTTPRYDVSTGELNQNDKGQLIRAFTGVVSTVQQGYNNGHHEITIQGEDVTKYMRISIINVNPALELEQFYKLADQSTATEPISVWGDILQNLTTPEIIRLVTLGSDALKVRGTALSQSIDGIGWYKFAEGGDASDIVYDANTNSIIKFGNKTGDVAKYDFTQMLGELFKENSVHIIDPYRPGGTGLKGFRPYELSIKNNWSFYQADFKTRRDIAYKSAEDSHFNFYADKNGHIWFHPFRFDISWILSAANPKVYIIDNPSIVSYGFVEDDNNIFTSVYASTEPDFGMESLGEYGFYKGSYKDEGSMLRYGQRIFIATNPIINTKILVSEGASLTDKTQAHTIASVAVTMYAKSLLQRILAGKYQGQITIAGRPEIEPGRPIYVPMRNMIYYVETVDHTLTFGQSYQTTLHLSYGRKPWEYLPELITFSKDDDIFAADAYTFRQTYYDSATEGYKGPPDTKRIKDVILNESSTQLSWGNHPSLPEGFVKKTRLICQKLSIKNPSYLMSCMAFETNGSFSPSVTNSSSGAVGLIQFTGSTCASLLGISNNEIATMEWNELVVYRDRFAQMTALEQLTYVSRYLTPYLGRMNTLSDVYMAILWPAAVGKSEDYVLFSQSDPVHPEYYQWNSSLDIDGDGKVTKAEATNKVVVWFNNGLVAPYVLDMSL